LKGGFAAGSRGFINTAMLLPATPLNVLDFNGDASLQQTQKPSRYSNFALAPTADLAGRAAEYRRRALSPVWAERKVKQLREGWRYTHSRFPATSKPTNEI
jgi:hypothetical protein